MILHEYRIEYKYGQEFILKPAFDWHVGHKYCDERALKAYLKDGEDNPDCYIITGGDLADSIITTDKRYEKGSDGNDGQAIINYQVDYLKDLIEPYRGRIIGIGLGNHERTILKNSGFHISRELAKHFQTTSLGYQWAVKLIFSEKGNRGRTLIIFGHHGYGGGSTIGYNLTKFGNHASSYDADVFLYGHVHRRQKTDVSRIGVIGKKMVDKPKRIYICGTFLKTFSDTDEPTWAETKGFPPVRLGGVNITLKPNNKWITIGSDI